MSNTSPSGPDIVNTKALSGFMRAFDKALIGKYDLSGGAMGSLPGPLTETLRTPKPVVMGVLKEEPHLSFWHTFPLVKTIVRFRDNVRLRKYNREWIKSNIH